jgi:hypothetical protein
VGGVDEVFVDIPHDAVDIFACIEKTEALRYLYQVILISKPLLK